jgi:hypothetical protein
MPATPRRRRKLRRPPFENRWADGATAWRWYVELQRLGPDHVRACLAQQALHDDERAQAPWAAAPGFVRDWLSYLERRERRIGQRWRLTILLVALVAALGAVISAWPVVRTWL